MTRARTMKSIIRYFSSFNGINFIYVILAYTTLLIRLATSSPPSCGLYGAPPCRFLPAPPGQTPSCARPGKTYCEHVENYPTYLIKHLVRKWGYEAKNLLVDETWDDFAAVAWQDTPVFYDPAYIFNQHNNNNQNNNNGKDFNGYNYEMPQYGSANDNGNKNCNKDPYQYTKPSTTEGPMYLLYASSTGRRLALNQNEFSTFSSNNAKSTPNNPTLWLKRFVRDLSKNQGRRGRLIIHNSDENKEEESSAKSSLTRNVSPNIDLWDIVGVQKEASVRNKRQSPGRTSLCSTMSRFITPQAALNSKGNWMFVVNEASTARQTVKAELCTSNTCSNLCQLPNGYNSRCEQKFVQKRLIALQSNGQNLYTDTFWFPSCCVCTISAS